MVLATYFDPKNTPSALKNSDKDKGKDESSNIKKDGSERGTTQTLINTNKVGGQQGNALGSYYSVKLNHENYLLWKNIVLPVIKGNWLEGFITRSKKCLPKFITITEKNDNVEISENPAYEE